MQITAIKVHRFEAPLASPIADARNIIKMRACVLVEVRTDSGSVGWGEAACFAGCGSLVAKVIDFFSSRLIGRNPADAESVFDELYGSSLHFGRRGLVLNALSGLDVALWDLKAQAEGVSLGKLLGAKREAVQVYYNGGYFVEKDPIDFVKKSAERALKAGVGALKIKIGRAVDDDVKRISAAREILGDDKDLMVDANGILNSSYLEALDPVLANYKIRWIEEPVALTRIKDLMAIRDVLSTPIAGYELEQTAPAWADLIEAGVVDIAQPDAIWSGGITECRRTFAVAEKCDVEWVPHNFATLVCLAANAHLAASAPTGGWLEVDSNDNPFLWALDPEGAFGISRGAIVPPDVPGLGFKPNLNAIEQYRVT